MKRNAQQTAFREGIHCQIQHCGSQHAIHNPLDFACSFLQHEQVVGANECHTGGLIQIFDYGAHAQIRVDQAWALRV